MRNFEVRVFFQAYLLLVALAMTACMPTAKEDVSGIGSSCFTKILPKKADHTQSAAMTIAPGALEAQLHFSRANLFAKLENIREINLADLGGRDASPWFKLKFWRMGEQKKSAPISLDVMPEVHVGPPDWHCPSCFIPVSDITHLLDPVEGPHYYLKDIDLYQPGPTVFWVKILDSNSQKAKVVDEIHCEISTSN